MGRISVSRIFSFINTYQYVKEEGVQTHAGHPGLVRCAQLLDVETSGWA